MVICLWRAGRPRSFLSKRARRPRSGGFAPHLSLCGNGCRDGSGCKCCCVHWLRRWLRTELNGCFLPLWCKTSCGHAVTDTLWSDGRRWWFSWPQWALVCSPPAGSFASRFSPGPRAEVQATLAVDRQGVVGCQQKSESWREMFPLFRAFDDGKSTGSDSWSSFKSLYERRIGGVRCFWGKCEQNSGRKYMGRRMKAGGCFLALWCKTPGGK